MVVLVLILVLAIVAIFVWVSVISGSSVKFKSYTVSQNYIYNFPNSVSILVNGTNINSLSKKNIDDQDMLIANRVMTVINTSYNASFSLSAVYYVGDVEIFVFSGPNTVLYFNTTSPLQIQASKDLINKFFVNPSQIFVENNGKVFRYKYKDTYMYLTVNGVMVSVFYDSYQFVSTIIPASNLESSQTILLNRSSFFNLSNIPSDLNDIIIENSNIEGSQINLWANSTLLELVPTQDFNPNTSTFEKAVPRGFAYGMTTGLGDNIIEIDGTIIKQSDYSRVSLQELKDELLDNMMDANYIITDEAFVHTTEDYYLVKMISKSMDQYLLLTSAKEGNINLKLTTYSQAQIGSNSLTTLLDTITDFEFYRVEYMNSSRQKFNLSINLNDPNIDVVITYNGTETTTTIPPSNIVNKGTRFEFGVIQTPFSGDTNLSLNFWGVPSLYGSNGSYFTTFTN